MRLMQRRQGYRDKKVFFVGNNVDKGNLDNILTKVSRDKYLKRLIRKGNNVILKAVIII